MLTYVFFFFSVDSRYQKEMSVPESLFTEHETVVCHARFAGKEDQKPKTFYYFGLQGLGELPRLLLEYTETPYDSVMFFSSKDFKNFAPFGQLPCYEGPELGDMVLTQSSAVCRHIARETGIFGNTPTEQALQDMLWEAGKDIISKMEVIHAEGSVDARFDGIIKGVIAIMDKGNVLTGKSLGYGEICVFQALHRISEIKPDFLNQYDERLKMFVMKVAETPSIANYLKSPRRVPLTENEQGKGHSGMGGYKYLSPLKPETVAKVYVK